jgi:hypothetical protein
MSDGWSQEKERMDTSSWLTNFWKRDTKKKVSDGPAAKQSTTHED